VPYPPDYGGVYDLFYKIKSLFEHGILIHLHCFEYGRGEQHKLNKFCKSVTYYKRKSILRSLSFRLPYIVSSRAANNLINNLLKDDFPILLEGIHCTFFLYTNQLKKRKVIVRLHNVEFEYYSELARSSRNIFKKLYFISESRLLKAYEKYIANKAMIVTVSEKDRITYSEKFQSKNIQFLPVFLPYKQVSSETGRGSFCLYHGNLSVAENEKAVLYLLRNIFDFTEIPFVVAGKNPSAYLQKIMHKNSNVCLVVNPSGSEMDELIQKAHVHILPSFNKTGIKIKLLNALFKGRFVIANNNAVQGTFLADLCNIANTPEEYKKILPSLFDETFTEEEIAGRKNILGSVYNNDANVQRLIQWIY
jgi:glycosyltransferase involved in cell wall biosynthesis